MTRVYSSAGHALESQRGVSLTLGDTSLAEPLQFIALALNGDGAAKKRFPDYRLTRLVTARLELDEHDLMQLSYLVGDEVLRSVSDVPRPFDRHLRHVITQYGLNSLFSGDGHGLYHHAIRPTGYDFHRDEVIPTDMERWRADYRGMPDERQMLAASIIWLYRAGQDSVWLRRVPCTWHAADAITCMTRTDVFRDWIRLFALYPGW